MTNVGYNVEWSQELRLRESLREYVAGSMLIDVAREAGLLGRPADPNKDETRLDLSVGYDLAGIRAAQLRTWLGSMRDARVEVEALRREIPDELRRFRELEFRTALSDHVTLSTFHGCPPAEIEAIVRFLLEELELHVTLKLNPTLLGREAVDGLLHDLLGYAEIETRPEDFANDLGWERALELTDRLTERARARGRTFRLKLSNTLVVRNHRCFFPASERVMYLSGAPLHVITMQLVERVRRARPEAQLSFSAGVDARNFPDCVALGLLPVTVCTDLLKPGGYGRLPRYLEGLEERMRRLGVRSLGDYVVKACGRGEAAIAGLVEPGPLRDALLGSLRSERVDLAGVLARFGRESAHEALVSAAARLNTPVVSARAAADPRYRAEAQRAVPRKLGTRLSLFDCVNCDKCLPACPNDANFVYDVPAESLDYDNFRVEGGRAVPVPGGRFEVREHHQIANFQDFCNDCGNCDTFCPEDGGPYLEKPRFFGSLAAWQRLQPRDGFFVEERGAIVRVWARVRGTEYRLELDRGADLARFGNGRLELELRHSERRPLRARPEPSAPEGDTLDVSAYLAIAVAVDGVLDPTRANPVNAAG
jgi:putative selenate reductase